LEPEIKMKYLDWLYMTQKIKLWDDADKTGGIMKKEGRQDNPWL